jgi:hypothetical protein
VAAHANNLNNARALEDGLLCVMLAPMALKFLLYFGLYWTLPRDRIEEVEDASDERVDEESGKRGFNAKEGKGKGGEEGAGSPRLPIGKGPVGSPIEIGPAGDNPHSSPPEILSWYFF